ncbi:MAG: MFS transporter [Salinivirgaceae bacterium]|nr:MFS transporter [Salinivirgaceae bacterium]
MLFFLSKGISFLQIGTLYALREISINILEIPTGVIADVLGRKKTIMTSFLTYIISFIVFYYSTSYALLLLGMLFYSFGDTLRTGTHKAMIFDYLKHNSWQSEKVAYYGHTRSWSQLGSAISSLLAAGIVIFTGNYEIIFLASTVPYIVNFMLIWSYPAKLDGPIHVEKSLSIKQRMKILYANSKQSAKADQLWKALFNMATFQGYFKAIKDYLQPIILLAVGSTIILTDVNPDRKSTLLLGLVYFAIYILSSAASRYANHLMLWLGGSEKTMNYSLIIGIFMGLLSGLFIYKSMAGLAAVLFVLIFIVQNIRKPVGTGLVAEKVENEVMATALSIQSLFDSLFASVLAIIIGFLADRYGVWQALTVVGLIVLFLVPFITLKTKFKANNY